jgi:hypothetical protein
VRVTSVQNAEYVCLLTDATGVVRCASLSAFANEGLSREYEWFCELRDEPAVCEVFESALRVVEPFLGPVELSADGVKVVGLFLECVGIPLASWRGDEVATVDVDCAGV